MNIAVIENNIVVNTIIADTVEIAETVTGKTCIEILENYPIGIDWTWNDAVQNYVPPKPYPSWVLNVSKKIWEAPTPFPNTEDVIYIWDEDSLSWVEE
jgi:hypothetical protein